MIPFCQFALRTAAALAVLGLLLPVSLPAAGSAPDLDGDGIPNIVDPDVDNDGIPNALDENVDGGFAKRGPYLGKYIGDHLDNANPAEKDIDGDELSDGSLAEGDIDGDGKRDDATAELDIDGDGRADDASSEKDIDGDGRNDDMLGEDDIDGDGYDDDDAAEMDTDGDDRLNGSSAEDDHDGDGLSDDQDDDRDGDGRSDIEDDDDNNDGVGDGDDGSPERPGEQKLSQPLAATKEAPGEASARVQLHLRASGNARFAVKVEHFSAGTYAVWVGDVLKGQLTVEAGQSEGQLAFDTHPDDPGEMLLDFNPAGLSVRIVAAAVDWFAGPAPSPSDGGGGAREWETDFVGSLAAAPNAEGEMELWVSSAGEVSLVIKIKNVAADVYDVRIGGIIRGQIAILANEDKTETALKFVASPSRSGEALLHFEAAHQVVAIEKSGIVYLSGTSPGPPSGP